jgi:hypothetical protein
MFTPATGFPAFQCTGGLPASREGNAKTGTEKGTQMKLKTQIKSGRLSANHNITVR